MHKLKRMVVSGSGWEETQGRDFLCSLVDDEILRCVWMKKFILFHSISFSSYWIVGPLLLLFSSETLKVSTFQIGCFHLWGWHSRKPRLKKKVKNMNLRSRFPEKHQQFKYLEISAYHTSQVSTIR